MAWENDRMKECIYSALKVMTGTKLAIHLLSKWDAECKFNTKVQITGKDKALNPFNTR